MIILFEENETEFTSLGLGTLKDASGCNVKESLNDAYDLQMEYPIDGHNFSKLIEGRIIYCKPNPYDEAQPFRIRSITKPIKGVVTVYADHISYDMVGIPVKAISGNNVNDTLDKVSKESIVSNNFKFKNHIESSRTFKTTGPYNMRQLLMDGDESIIGVYEGEVKFNGFLIELFKQRGKDRGAKVVYGKNMTDLSHESNSEKLYNGLYPYYHQEKTENNTIDNKEFTKGYIVGSKPFMAGWLSFSENGEPYQPTSETPIQIATEGEYFDKVYAWSERNQKYIEKIYNEQFTIMQGLVEPSWITIDWSKFPVIAARAAKNGYFKKATDQDWGEFKAVGDIIFEGSIVNSGITESLILYFSEVIPDNGSTENQSVSEVVLVELDHPIIPIETQWTKNMKRKRILSVNFASEFDEEPTKDQLKQKAEEYIKKNKIGEIKHTTTVSFVDLASTTEKDKYQNFDHIELGDNVRVIYEDLGVDVNLRVISTEYDVLSEKYTNIELGEKEDKFSSTTVQTGDGVSSLSNDADYTDATRVKKLIADTVTAEYLEATNAKLGEAAIKQLEVQRINIKGILEASQFSIDELVAKMLTSENAKISNELQAGTVKIDGNITARTGNIGGFTIDENSLTNGTIGEDNSVVMCTGSNTYAIIAGSEKINNWVFTAGKNFGVTKEGNLYARKAKLTEAEVSGAVNITSGSIKIGEKFSVNNDGSMHASNANISGSITATTLNCSNGTLSSFNLDSNSLSIGQFGKDNSVLVCSGTNGYAIIGGSENINGWVFTAGSNFGVTKDGIMYAKEANVNNINIKEGEIKIGKRSSSVKNNEEVYNFDVDNNGNVNIHGNFHSDGSITAGIKNQQQIFPFEVDPNGKLTATNVNISGIISSEEGNIGGFKIDPQGIYQNWGGTDLYATGIFNDGYIKSYSSSHQSVIRGTDLKLHKWDASAYQTFKDDINLFNLVQAQHESVYIFFWSPTISANKSDEIDFSDGIGDKKVKRIISVSISHGTKNVTSSPYIKITNNEKKLIVHSQSGYSGKYYCVIYLELDTQVI